jgi:hypothetical protein
VSQQSDADVQILGVFRFGLSISLVLLLVWGVASQYQSQRYQAQITSMRALAALFAERAALVHGLWLSQNRPVVVYEAGRAFELPSSTSSETAVNARYVMSTGGWPQGSVQDQEPGLACRQLWLQLLSVPLMLDGEPVAVSPLIASPGCEFRMGEAGFSYRFADGSVTTRGG